MANSYVSVKHDSFKNRTTTTSGEIKYTLDARRVFLSDEVAFNFRHIVSDSVDGVVIDAHFKSIEANREAIRNGSLRQSFATYPGEWAFLRNGELIIQINGEENIVLDAHENSTNVTTSGITQASACEEWVFYMIDLDILEKICEAKTIKMQLSGSAGEWVIDGSKMVPMAKAMYNALDETKYADEIAQQEAQDKKYSKIGCAIMVVIGILIVAFLVYVYGFSDY